MPADPSPASASFGPASRKPNPKRGGTSLLVAWGGVGALVVLVVLGIIWVGNLREAAAERKHQRVVDEIATQCDAMYEVVISDRPLEQKSDRLVALGVMEYQTFGSPYRTAGEQERYDVMADDCHEVVERGQDVVAQQRGKDDAAANLAYIDADDDDVEVEVEVDEEAIEECGRLGGWVADSYDAGRFTEDEYDSWLGIVDRCFEDAGS